MAELILGSFVDSLAGRVLSSLFDEIGLTRGVKLEFNKLVAILSLIRGYLQDAEKRQVDDEALKFWLKQLQDLAYETDDLLDDFNTEAIRRRSAEGVRKKMVNEVSIFFSSSNRLIYANRMAHRIKDLKEKLDFLRNLAGLFNLQSVSKSPSLVERHHGRPLTVPYDYEPHVIGRDKEKENVMDFLLDPKLEGNLSILPIVGFGGLGKTTLAREVFKNVQAHFQKQIWVCVSTNFVVEEILQKIVGPCSEKGDKLHEKLEKELGGKKYLLVLDDVWNDNESKWSKLKKQLPPGAEGSRMLVTTRSHSVANIVVNTIDERQCTLRGLNDGDSLTLLMRMARNKDVEWKNQKIEEIAKNILNKCGGVPLAIMTIGGLLSSRFSEREWSTLLEEDFSRIEQKEGDIVPTLKISYDFLPSHLKQCFAYCCLFPKDYKLDPNELVRLWMAQGFIFKSSTTSSKSLHDVGREYFMELASRSFFQDVERDQFGNITGCKMHDLMHDLATKVAGDNYTTIVNCSGASHENIPKEVRHVSMGDDKGSYNLKSLGPNQRIIRSLLFINHYHWQEKTLSGDISSFRNLRALRLHRLAKGDVLRSIGKLKHLRSLDLSLSTKLMSLPNSIGKLLNLETLILHGCEKLESLPRGVTKLVNLRHLNVEGCDSLTCMPSGIGNLTNLKVLAGFRVEERGNWNAARINELRRLTGLEELSISYLDRVKKESDSISTSDADYFWIDKSNLQRLHLSWRGRAADDPSEYAEEVLKRLKPNLDLLKSFTIEEYPGTTLASWTRELHNLVAIKLYSCDHIRSIPPLDQLSSLKSIQLSDCKNMRSIPPLDQLSSLKSIQLSDCKNMRSIPPLDQLSSLKSIQLSDCKNMRSIPPLDQLPSLKSIYLKDMDELEWIEVTENKSICLYRSLEEIHLKGLPMLKGWKRKRMDVNRSGDQTIHSSSPFFIPSFSRKVDVSIFGCGMLSYMRDDNERLILSGMKYKDLEELCRMNRRNVEEEECSSISTTPMGSLTFVPLSSVPLHKVTSLSLHHLDDTEELPMELFQSLSRLQSLKITECHLMRSIPPLDQLSSLESIELSHCKNMRSIPPLDQLSSLESIELSHCKNMRSIQPLDQLPSLKSISLKYMEKLEWIEVTENKSICLYPSLEEIDLQMLPMLKGWKRKRMDVNRSGDQTIHSSSPFFIPSFSKKVKVTIRYCGVLCCTWNDNERVSLQVGGMKYKDLEELCRRNRSNVEEEEQECSSISTTQMGSLTLLPLSSVPLHTVTSLSLHHLEDTEELPSELFQSLSHLQSLEITECLHMRSIPPLDQLPSLKSIELNGLRELEWIEVTENKSICLYPSLERVYLAQLPMFKGWKRKMMDVNRSGDQTIHSSSSSPFFIPSFSKKVQVQIGGCGMLSYMRDDNERLILSGMKYKDLEELWKRNRRDVEEEECSSISTTQMGSLTFVPLSSVPLHKVTSLSLHHLDDTEELPMELFQSLCCLQSLNITECHRMRSIPPLDQLPSLKSIDLKDMEELEWIEVTENKSICLYPSLEVIELDGLPMLKGWKRKRMDVNRSGDQTIHSSSPFFIPSFSRKVDVIIYACGMLSYMRDDNERLILSGMKYKDLEELWSRRDVEQECSSISTTQMGSLTLLPLSSVPLHKVTSLCLHHLDDTEGLPSELFQSLLHLQYFYIIECHRLKSLSGWAILRYLCSLERLEIHNCKELDLSSMDQEEDNKAIQGIPNSQTKMRELTLFGMDKMKTLPPWIQYLPKLEILLLHKCKNMETLPGWFSQLTSLKTLKVIGCGELSRKCKRDTGECWPQISHIEVVDILAYEEEAA